MLAGANIVCTFTNTKDSTVRYIKVTDPACDAQDFIFGVTGTGRSATLDTDSGSAGTPSTTSTRSTRASSGAKTVTETARPAGR